MSAPQFRRLLSSVLLAASFGAASFPTHGADVLKVIIPTPPGGGTDGYFRVLAREAEPLLNTSATTIMSSPS